MRRASTATTSICAVCVLAAAAIVGVSLSAQAPGGNPEAAKMKNPVPMSADAIGAGKASFAKYCRFCHGDEAKGDGKMAPKDSHPSDLTDAKWDRGSTDGEIFAVIQNGAGPKFEMKGFKGRMTDQQIWEVVDYLRSLGPATAKKVTSRDRPSIDGQPRSGRWSCVRPFSRRVSRAAFSFRDAPSSGRAPRFPEGDDRRLHASS